MRHYEIVFLVHPDQSEQVTAMTDRYKAPQFWTNILFKNMTKNIYAMTKQEGRLSGELFEIDALSLKVNRVLDLENMMNDHKVKQRT